MRRIGGEPVIERVAHRLLDDALRFGGGEAVLGLALEFRLTHEHRQHAAGAGHDVVAGDRRGALFLADSGGVVLQAAQQRRAQTGLVGAAVGRRDGVAVGVDEAVGVGGPGDRPFGGAVAAGLAGRAGEDFRMHQRGAGQVIGEIVLEAVGEMEVGLLRNVVEALQQLLGAVPADFDAAEQIRFGARHLEQALRPERGLGPEDLRVGLEAHLGAAPVGRAADLDQLALRLAALEGHAIELLTAGDFDFQPLRQSVGDRNADAMQAAGRLVDLGVEFAAGVQRAHDHFQRRLVLELGMRIDRDAAAVVVDGDEAVGFHLDLDPVSVAGQRLVHGVVDHFREEVMQRLLVGAADIHAGPAAHRLEPFQHLDVLGAVAGVRRCRRGAAFAGFSRAALPRAGALRPAGARGVASNRSGWGSCFLLVAVLAMGAFG